MQDALIKKSKVDFFYRTLHDILHYKTTCNAESLSINNDLLKAVQKPFVDISLSLLYLEPLHA